MDVARVADRVDLIGPADPFVERGAQLVLEEASPGRDRLRQGGARGEVLKAMPVSPEAFSRSRVSSSSLSANRIASITMPMSPATSAREPPRRGFPMPRIEHPGRDNLDQHKRHHDQQELEQPNIV